jgi:EAL domain-containing protein (putative c-di-GMP-specific phosphodiesterase class I)
VLEEAMNIAQTVRQRAPDFVVAVNISPKQFRREEFVRDLHALVVGSGLPPEALMLEITEGVLLQEQLARRVVLLSEEGYRFSLDDFGTGYSSLAYLKRLPVHELKIDRAFVRDIETDPEDAALVQAILAIAERFGIHTVAEGIETSAQLDFLAHHGCGAVQGFLLDKPRPWRQFVQEFLGP